MIVHRTGDSFTDRLLIQTQEELQQPVKDLTDEEVNDRLRELERKRISKPLGSGLYSSPANDG